MNENIEPRSKNEANIPMIDDVQDYENVELRTLFEEHGIIREGDIITADDYQAIKSRASVLLEQSPVPMSAETALLNATFDRLHLKEKIGMEALKALPVETLQALFYRETTGVLFTTEEIQLFKDSPLQFDDWMSQRQEVKKNLQ